MENQSLERALREIELDKKERPYKLARKLIYLTPVLGILGATSCDRATEYRDEHLSQREQIESPTISTAQDAVEWYQARQDFRKDAAYFDYQQATLISILYFVTAASCAIGSAIANAGLHGVRKDARQHSSPPMQAQDEWKNPSSGL